MSNRSVPVRATFGPPATGPMTRTTIFGSPERGYCLQNPVCSGHPVTGHGAATVLLSMTAIGPQGLGSTAALITVLDTLAKATKVAVGITADFSTTAL